MQQLTIIHSNDLTSRPTQLGLLTTPRNFTVGERARLRSLPAEWGKAGGGELESVRINSSAVLAVVIVTAMLIGIVLFAMRLL